MHELLEHAATGKITPTIEVLEFSDMRDIFERLRTDSITGRIVVRIPQ